MLSYFFRQMINSLGIFFRTIRAFFTRRLTGLGARIRRITNFSRQATRVASESFQEAAAAIQKPTKREDYIETKRLFISKSFLIVLAIGLVALGVFFYFVIWPFLLSHFLTAHFYRDDKRVPDWSGRVIVYYDAKKKHPMYAGRLEDGILQGEGMQYDENGLVTYKGSFVDGLADGSGKDYQDGALLYDGTFAAGKYDGEGELYQDGHPLYQGAFLDGEYAGEGTLFYSNGVKAYAGNFTDGLQEGTGTAYRKDGSVCYKGSFASGKYDGKGTWYLEEDQGAVQANFTAGETDGAIEWYKNGKLWYDGSADNLIPDGFGTIYAEDGKPVYTGEMDRGTVSGVWLLGLTADGVRTAFDQANVSETDQAGGGFLITDQELGVRVLCSYRQGDSDAAVCSLWLTGEGTDGTMSSLMPWKTAEDFARWAQENPDQHGTQYRFPGAAPAESALSGGTYDQVQYAYGDWSCTGLFPQTGGGAAAVCWSSGSEVPAANIDDSTAVSPAQAQLDQLLSALDLVQSGGGESQTPDSAAGDPGRMVGLMTSAADAKKLVDTLLNDYENTQIEVALAESEPLLQQLLAEEQARLDKGAGDQEKADTLQGELDALDGRIAQARANQEQAALVAQNMTKLDPADYALEKLICNFDPSGLDAGALCQAAADYARAVAAGRYAVDADGLNVSVKTALINLEMAYQSVQSALAAEQRAAAAVEQDIDAYAKGSVEKYELYHAQCAQNDAAAALYSALADFSRQANGLNDLSGGWFSQNQGWLGDTLPAVYQGEITRGQAAAQAAEDQQADKEAAAREQLQASSAPAP